MSSPLKADLFVALAIAVIGDAEAAERMVKEGITPLRETRRGFNHKGINVPPGAELRLMTSPLSRGRALTHVEAREPRSTGARGGWLYLGTVAEDGLLIDGKGRGTKKVSKASGSLLLVEPVKEGVRGQIVGGSRNQTSLLVRASNMLHETSAITVAEEAGINRPTLRVTSVELHEPKGAGHLAASPRPGDPRKHAKAEA